MAKGLELSSLDFLSRQEAGQLKGAGTKTRKAQWSEPQAVGPHDALSAVGPGGPQLRCSCPGNSLIARVRIQSHGGKIRTYLQFMHYIKIREASNGF